MVKLNTIKNAPIKNKRILLRLELNLPLKNGKITDDSRIIAALPTIKYLLKKKPKQLIIISHLGRPQGRWVNRLSMKQVAKVLEKKLKKKVFFYAKHIIKTKNLPNNKIIFLENIRFYKEEEQNNKAFAKHVASFADIYCNDAFGNLHRKHASVNAITNYLPSYAGLLIEKEIKALSKIVKPKRPYIAIIAGGKADKLLAIKSIAKQANTVLVGGTSANMILQAQGHNIQQSKTESKYKSQEYLLTNRRSSSKKPRRQENKNSINKQHPKKHDDGGYWPSNYKTIQANNKISKNHLLEWSIRLHRIQTHSKRNKSYCKSSSNSKSVQNNWWWRLRISN